MSLINLFFSLGAVLDWFLNTVSSYHLFLNVYMPTSYYPKSWFSRGFAVSTSSCYFFLISCIFSISFLLCSSSLSLLIFAYSLNNSNSSSSSSSSSSLSSSDDFLSSSLSSCSLLSSNFSSASCGNGVFIVTDVAIPVFNLLTPVSSTSSTVIPFFLSSRSLSSFNSWLLKSISLCSAESPWPG